MDKSREEKKRRDKWEDTDANRRRNDRMMTKQQQQ
jgi:hypothetical protein